jgi:hypothetical protein
MMLRTRHDAQTSLGLNRELQECIAMFGELQKMGQAILEKLAAAPPKET